MDPHLAWYSAVSVFNLAKKQVEEGIWPSGALLALRAGTCSKDGQEVRRTCIRAALTQAVTISNWRKALCLRSPQHVHGK